MTDEAFSAALRRRTRSLTRRRWLALAGGLVAGAVLLVRRSLRASALEDDAALDRPSRVVDERPYEPYRAPVFAGGAPAIAFAALGDVGWGGSVLEGVVDAMERTASALPFDFVCLLGDNFYPSGVTSALDPRWEELEHAFDRPHLALPIRAALGNHDHNGNVEAQVEYGARSKRWSMPAQYYAFTEPVGGGLEAEFFVLDTEALRRRERESEEQLRWLEDKLASSRAHWKIVIGHHPVRSNGEHGGIDRVREDVEPLLERYQVALYVSGHDHDLELLDTGRGFVQVVSGASSSTRDLCWRDDTLFASASPGFVWIGIRGEELWLVFVDAQRGPLFSRRLTRGAAELAPVANRD